MSLHQLHDGCVILRQGLAYFNDSFTNHSMNRIFQLVDYFRCCSIPTVYHIVPQGRIEGSQVTGLERLDGIKISRYRNTLLSRLIVTNCPISSTKKGHHFGPQFSYLRNAL